MTRSDLKNLILECIDEKMDDIIEKILKSKSHKRSIEIYEVESLRKDVDFIADKNNLNLPSSDLPF